MQMRSHVTNLKNIQLTDNEAFSVIYYLLIETAQCLKYFWVRSTL